MSKPDYRTWVGNPEKYDLIAAIQFNLLTTLGLREHHTVLDIGCGSLRLGRLLIPYLAPGNYFGIEPEDWVVVEGIRHETGYDIITVKRPHFSNNADFDCGVFGCTFDYIMAQSIFSHTSLEQMEKCMRNARTAMDKDSIFVFNYKLGEQDYQGDTWHYPRTIRYTRETVNALSKRCGLLCRELDVPNTPDIQIWVEGRRNG